MKNAKPKPRVVIDSNVFISALVFGGKPREVTRLIADKSIMLFVSEECLSELRRKIVSKFPEYINELVRLERLLGRRAKFVKLGIPQIKASRDLDDNKFIETAVLGKCGFIVSGDKDLLDIDKYQNIRIVTPSEFLTLSQN